MPDDGVVEQDAVAAEHGARLGLEVGLAEGQEAHPERRRQATTYYCRESGVGTALTARNEFLPQRVGVIGLGTGTLATYGRVGDEYHIFEINPLVLQLARGEFSFINESRATVKVHLGDARLSLERMEPLKLDVLAVDAFSGDSVPVHLLTKEAMELYWRHLNPDGMLAVHISNRYLDLRNVVSGSAASAGFSGIMIYDEGNSEPYYVSNTWTLFNRDKSFFAHPNFAGTDTTELLPDKNFRSWTDDYSNILKILN